MCQALCSKLMVVRSFEPHHSPGRAAYLPPSYETPKLKELGLEYAWLQLLFCRKGAPSSGELLRAGLQVPAG